jgi:hypothetical protein
LKSSEKYAPMRAFAKTNVPYNSTPQLFPRQEVIAPVAERFGVFANTQKLSATEKTPVERVLFPLSSLFYHSEWV